MFKINISEKSGKTYKLEVEAEGLMEKSLHDKISGKELMPELDGYELEIAGASDKAGFTAMKGVEGIGLNRVLLTYGKAMHKRPRREGKKKVSNPKPKGLRMRKTVRGQVISPEISQVNLKVLKEGAKKLSEVFAEQNKKEEVATETSQPTEQEKSAKSQSDSENKELISKENPEPERLHESASQQKRVGSGDEGEANVSKEIPKEEVKEEKKE